VTFVEKHPQVFRQLEENIRQLQGGGLGETRCVRADALRWLERAGERFDLILADPPYDLPDALERTLNGIAEHSVLTEGGTLVYELRSQGGAEVPDRWTVVRDRKYGKTRVLILKLNSEERA
jgi:16S rRNA (guanine966-N2)-methyltransferase